MLSNYLQKSDLTTQFEMERAISYLTRSINETETNRKKPVILHSITVGYYLYYQNYSLDRVLAGFSRY
ncbi:MAG: hypothetical protein KAR35_02980 [Candidatus Heimdallarchaeota archaeon]|nr:hypothetical protein [Candidatus Heimdallarchaeota archaeon]MCK5048319.1 hypothetical protein [Candidatus Heimdallarchaeota archaeon]